MTIPLQKKSFSHFFIRQRVADFAFRAAAYRNRAGSIARAGFVVMTLRKKVWYGVF
jgi:hypothetical protein